MKDKKEEQKAVNTLANPIDYPDISELLDEPETQPSNIKRRKRSVFENLGSWLFYEFIFNTDLFGEKFVDNLTAWGQRKYDKYHQQYLAVDEALCNTIFDETYHGANYQIAKKASGIYNPNGLCRAVSNMHLFCQFASKYAEQNCMQFSLRANSVEGLVAAFYYPALRWELFKSIFTRS